MCVDGGMTNNLPRSNNPNLITVSPFSGECDISPKESQTHHEIMITGMPAQICWSNVFKGIGALLPMAWEEVEGLYHQGQRDAQRYLEREGTNPHCCRVDSFLLHSLTVSLTPSLFHSLTISHPHCFTHSL